MGEYAGHPLVGTLGIPLVVYPGLKVSRFGVFISGLIPIEIWGGFIPICFAFLIGMVWEEKTKQ